MGERELSSIESKWNVFQCKSLGEFLRKKLDLPKSGLLERLEQAWEKRENQEQEESDLLEQGEGEGE